MSAGWVVYGLVTGTLLAVCGVAIEGLCRQHRMPTRWVWAACIGAAVAVVLTSTLTSVGAAAKPVVALPEGVKVATAGATTTVGIFSAFATTLDAAAALVQSGVVAIARLLPERATLIVGMLWIVCSLAALVILAFVHLRMRRVRRAWPTAELQGRRVRIAPSVGPAVVGVVNPEIVVPQWLLHRTEEEQRVVVAHESEHVRGRDHLLLGGATLAVALVPWHPAVWWMLSRLRLAIELDCDARVLRCGVPARRYGAVLIDLAERCAGFQVGATALADEASHLERRLLAMKPTRSTHVHLRAVVLFVCAGVSLLAACEAKVPTAAEISAMDVAGAQHSVMQAKMMDERALAQTTFYVNGARVTAREAHAITPNQIATVRIEQGQHEDPTIFITTNGQAPTPESATERSALKRLHATMHGEATQATGPMKLRTPGPDNQMMSGLILVDGVRIDAAAFQRLNAKDFKTVDIIKGPEAAKLYSDPAAANGVIRIRTK
ncbi:MAG: M56 family metallopeptidase [Gemmatimonadota bacterium]|nr:M56 family metallopeptidase [Gemmatimonadota bacterium]